MSFLTSAFAIAGLALATGPLIIHLLNRRRFKVVDWAAMDFLKEAVRSQRRILTLKDYLLLAIRTLCVLFFGAALAQPIWNSSADVVVGGKPVHAILVIDNSLSMSYGSSNNTSLDQAKKQAKDLVERLPAGSRYSILPLCHSNNDDFSFDPERTKEAAEKAIDAVQILDMTANVAAAIAKAEKAAESAPDLKSKHIVFFGDQQGNCWPKGIVSGSLLSSVEELNNGQGKLNVVQVNPASEKVNAWIEDLRVQDEVADAESTTIFIVKLKYQGDSADAQEEVQVWLDIDGEEKAPQTVTLRHKGTREVLFSHKYGDSDAVDTGFSRVEAKIDKHDKFARDDVRYLSVPVLRGVKVVFIDQYGSEEDPARNRYGETAHVRRLLAPSLSGKSQERQLIKEVHLKMDQIDRDGDNGLEDARLVVVGGVVDPDPDSVQILREYVEQGGQLFIAAGGDFDPVKWNASAWDDGKGILPGPLEAEAFGKSPSDGVKELEPFYIDYSSLATDSFLLPEESDENLAELYEIPLFFKAVAVDIFDKQEKEEFLKRETDAIKAVRAKAAADAAAAAGKGPKVVAPRTPRWLNWKRDVVHTSDQPEQLAEKLLPIVLAKYTNGLPMLLERRIGEGKAVLFTSGLSSDWNTLTRTNAVLVLDRILRGLLRETLQKVNFKGSETVSLGIRADERLNEFGLKRPKEVGAEDESKVEGLGAEARGFGGDEIVVRGVRSRGHYVVSSYEKGSNLSGKELWSRPLAVNGPVEESLLDSADHEVITSELSDDKKDKVNWILAGGDLSLGGIGGQDLWKYLLGLVLVLLLLEIIILAWKPIRVFLGFSNDAASASGEGVA